MGPISGTGNQVSIPAAAQTQSVEAKRTALQSMLLKKALDAQRQQGEQSANAFEGKGQVIDVRV